MKADISLTNKLGQKSGYATSRIPKIGEFGYKIPFEYREEEKAQMNAFGVPFGTKITDTTLEKMLAKSSEEINDRVAKELKGMNPKSVEYLEKKDVIFHEVMKKYFGEPLKGPAAPGFVSVDRPGNYGFFV